MSSGSSGGSSKKLKKSDEIDRYHEISKTLERLKRDYDSITKAKERAFGKDKLRLMDEEIKKSEEILKAEEQYLSEIQSNF
jgi:hypothetical protein